MEDGIESEDFMEVEEAPQRGLAGFQSAGFLKTKYHSRHHEGGTWRRQSGSGG